MRRSRPPRLIGASTIAFVTAAAMPIAPSGGQPASSGPLAASTSPPAPVSEQCAGLLKADFSKLPEAGARIIRVKSVAATPTVPAYCDVRGTIQPNVGFALKLPEGNWNGRYFQAGCGNYCGIIYEQACDDPLRRGYACIATDSGHVARPEDIFWTDGQWAEGNLQAALDWGGRASHVTAQTGKAITAFFYGKAPAKSYFMGCSYGGHQAMVLAQRYPWDFDGIVGGGAPNNMATLMQQNVWALQIAYDSALRPMFSQADVEVLHANALALCDKSDGVRDGLIGNPGACRIDTQALICKPGQASGCLTPEKAHAAALLYAGPSDRSGKAITAGGWMPGTELFWRKVYRPDGAGLAALAPNYFRYMARNPALGPGWSVRDYDFDTDPKRNDAMETLFAADNPDLRRFKEAGGKFIDYSGWYDMGTVPAGAVDYYRAVERSMGGQAATQDFFRLFTLPGALHCRGGDGAEHIDYLTYIEKWVEKGEAPDMMLGAHKDADGKIAFTRPHYPFPLYARYVGHGQIADAGSFRPAQSN